MMKWWKRSDWVVLGMVATVFAAVNYVSTLDQAVVAALVLAVFCTIVQARSETQSESLRQPRFWCVVGFLAAAHILALALIRVPELPFGAILVPFAFADFLAMQWLIDWTETRLPRR